MYRLTRPRDVPPEMIEAATARRLAGDLAGAFAAARVELDVDIPQIVRSQGRELADQVVDDLFHIAPDLLRWNVPRALETAGRPGALIVPGVLRRYPDGDGANLVVDTVWKQPTRLRLWVQTGVGRGELPDRVPGWYHLPRAYWDVRYTGELRDLCGGGPARIPFHDATGRLLEVLPDGPRPDDPAAMTEWVTSLWDEGRTGAALAACGIALAEGEPESWPKRPWVAVERLTSDARRVLGEGVFDKLGGSWRAGRPDRTIWFECRDEGQGGTDIELTFGPGDQATARLRRPGAGDTRVITAPEYRHPIDLDLLRFGLARPEDLHPAVAQALFPNRSAGAGNPPGVPPRTDGWELMDRAFHHDTAGVQALLDAGADPLVRDRSGLTLLHLLPHLDHELLLPRLLAAGADVNAVDLQGHTPLHAAAAYGSKRGRPGGYARRSIDGLIARLRNAGGADVCGTRGAPCPAGAPDSRRPATDEDVDRLRAAASRPRYASLAELAWALYSTGKDRREVLAECYGAPFPDEFFALADHLPLPGHRRDDLNCQAWRLALPPDRGGPVPPDDSGSHDYLDRVVFKRDPQLVPLLRLRDSRTEYGGVALCYHLTELAHGRPTIFGLDPRDDKGAEQLGPSLVAVLRDYHATVVDRLEALRRLAPEHDHIGGLAPHREALRLVESLSPAGAPGVARSVPAAPFLAPLSEATLARLRGRASRGDYRSMARLAWALYAAGMAPDQVISECLGVEFPAEFFVLADAGPDEAIPGSVTSLPWSLAVPLDRGGPVLRPDPMSWRRELRIFAWDPDLVPLLTLPRDNRRDHSAGVRRGVPHGGRLHCYRLSELSAGRTTVYGVPADGDELFAEASGASLLAVLHEHAAGRHALDAWELRQPSNRGAGSLDAEDVRDAARVVAGIAALQGRVADRLRDVGR
jgi:hypothetical protein